MLRACKMFVVGEDYFHTLSLWLGGERNLESCPLGGCEPFLAFYFVSYLIEYPYS